MPSSALEKWRGERAALLDQLLQAHTAVGGTGAGRRRATEELNRALLLRCGAVPGVRQGPARGGGHHVRLTRRPTSEPDACARDLDRPADQAELDRSNAQEESLASDFGRFGIVLWDAMERHDKRTGARRERLKWFNTARNALAHDDAAKLAKVIAAGYRIDLTWVRRWRRVVDGLAGTMDAVMAAHLARLFDVERPW